MKLSIIIVNYNVAYFLEQCLKSILVSDVDFKYEIWVVDNDSSDGSVGMLKSKFPEVKCIANKVNYGFSKANNQALQLAKGEYQLLLNPDTLLEKDSLQNAIDFMDEHPDAGGLGVKMVDGKGNFLPESKRGFPTPSAAFYKIFGFSNLFPKSKRFAAYHLGYLSPDEIHEVDVLSGAFMLLRKECLDKIGYLDESFFMYGEDIDLSYRVILGGYKNYYFPKSRIIHYKGESTKKDSVNYVFVFYKAMIIFAKKHFSPNNARMFSLLINMAIIFKAFLSITTNFVKRLFLGIIDFGVIYATLLAFTQFWGGQHLGSSHHYPPIFLYIAIPLLILFNLLSIYYSGGYEKPIKVLKIIRGQLFASAIVLIVYALLPESYRFSRLVILFSMISIPILMLLWRLLFNMLGFKAFQFGNRVRRKIAIIGDAVESKRVEEVITSSLRPKDEIIKFDIQSEDFVGIDERINKQAITEVIFCAKNMSSAQIIDQMTALQHLQLDYKIAPPESLFIIGSNSIHTAGDIYFQDFNAINSTSNLRFKRLLDFTLSFFLIIVSPLYFYFFKKPLNLIGNLMNILLGRSSFVGFNPQLKSEIHLPNITTGVLYPEDSFSNGAIHGDVARRLNMAYARNYKLSHDISIIFRGFRKLDKQI